jgi:hypothetical protein
MQSTENKILSKIKKCGGGKLVFGKDFALLGTDFTIRQVLSRLCKEGIIVRLSPGIYLYPKTDKNREVIYPSIDDIIRQIARRDKARIIPTGLYALNALGLSTQVPMRYVFLTDGAPRTIKIRNLKVKFQKTTPKNLSYKSKICVLVIFALKEIGKGKVRADELQKIHEALSHENNEIITHDALLAPQWVSEILLNYIKQKTK